MLLLRSSIFCRYVAKSAETRISDHSSLLMLGRSSSTQAFTAYPSDVQTLATKLEDARSQNHQIPPLTASTPGLSLGKAYEVSSAIRALRCEHKNDTALGRKIGFTNKSIWPEYNVDRSNWSYMYRNSVIDMSKQRLDESISFICDISEFSNLEPKIEPEIVLGLKTPIESTMSDEEILRSIDWMAHGFEIVVSVFPGWNFTAADTTAAFALHGKLLLGPKSYLPQDSASSSDLLGQLETLKVRLLRNGSEADEGVGSNVLGSPIKALRHLAELLEKDKVNIPLGADEMVTTGTLTRALSISDGDRWQTEIDGLEVAPLDVRFRMKK